MPSEKNISCTNTKGQEWTFQQRSSPHEKASNSPKARRPQPGESASEHCKSGSKDDTNHEDLPLCNSTRSSTKRSGRAWDSNIKPSGQKDTDCAFDAESTICAASGLISLLTDSLGLALHEQSDCYEIDNIRFLASMVNKHMACALKNEGGCL